MAVNRLGGHSVKVGPRADRRLLAAAGRRGGAGGGSATAMAHHPRASGPMNLDLGLIGNGTVSGLMDPLGEIVWSCFPRFDGDPAFCSLLRGTPGEDDTGLFRVGAHRPTPSEQEYLDEHRRSSSRGSSTPADRGIEITDFAPRFHQFGRMFCPMMLVRRITRITGNPRIRIRLRPAHHYGALAADADPRQQSYPVWAARPPPAHHRRIT